MAIRGRSLPIQAHINNAFLRYYTKSYTFVETVTSSDVTLRSITRNLVETVTNTDVFTSIKVISAILLETVTNTDTLIRSITRNLVETVTNTDVLVRGIQKVVTEVVTSTDVITSYVVKIITLYEQLTLIEDFRIFLNSKVARWRNKYNESKTQDWVEKQDL